MVSVTLQVEKRWGPPFQNHPFQDSTSKPVVQSRQVAHSTLRITQASSNSWPNLLGMVSCFKAGQCFRFLKLQQETPQDTLVKQRAIFLLWHHFHQTVFSTGPRGEFQMCTQNSNLFGSPVTTESQRDTRFFGTSASPFSACSIFGEPSPTTTNQQPESAEFSFSFGPTSLTTDDSSSNRSSTFSLFESFH